MLLELLIVTLVISLTVVLHAFGLDFTMTHLRRAEKLLLTQLHRFWRPLLLAGSVLFIFALHVAEIWLWAFVFYGAGALADFKEALYFSTTCFTTLGFGDVLLQEPWRLLGPAEAANGLMLFAWSAAFTFEILARLYRAEAKTL